MTVQEGPEGTIIVVVSLLLLTYVRPWRILGLPLIDQVLGSTRVIIVMTSYVTCDGN